ncbi:MAG: hypothetical protein HY581_00395, partial [Nitrospirae bacterium]|nr:hypothetical protein [Nitrospirota bacterium]
MPLPDKLSVSLDNQGFIDIAFNPKKPPHVFFDTNVLLSMGTADIEALKRLQAVRGFRYRYSMLNFTELASHLCDAPSKKYKSPFRRYQVAFQRLTEHFYSVLPSAESVFMQAAGLKHYLDPVWIVDPADITR